jgi:two-component system, cell cycle sensor histidine kinase and response regulator CckA
MGKVRQLSIGNQVMLIFGLICAILVAIGVFLFFSLRAIERRNEELQTQILREWKLSNDLSRNLSLEQIEIYRHVQANDPEEIKRHDQTISSLEEANAMRLDDYGKLVDNETETRFYATALQAEKNYDEQTESMLALSRVNRDMEAKDLAFSKQAPAYEDYQKAMNDIADWTAKEGGEMATSSTRLIVQTRRLGDALVGLAILVTIGTGFALVGVARRLKEDNIVLQTEVAERKRAEETLHESEEKFRQMAENITDMFWMTSPDMQQVLYVSPAYESIWGHSAESLYAHPSQWAEAIPPEDRERVFTLFSSLGTGISSASTEFQILRPDGEMRWIHGRGFPVRDDAGSVIRLTGIASDITERKKAGEALRLLSSAVEQAKESIVITDAELDLPGPRIIFVNPAFTRMTGYTAEEAIGKTPRILQGPRTDKTVLRRLRQNLERGEVFEGEAINYRKDGTEFNLEWQIAGLRNIGGKITHFVAIQRDITERKQLEGRMFQSQKMETVGKLAGGVAHEFNSILTAIIGQSELMLSDLPPDDPLVKNALEIRQAADRAATLTRQLLAYGRKQILQPEILDLNQVFSDMAGTLQHLMGREVDVRIVPAVGLKKVKIDPGQMEQVIVNVAMNAADAMPNGGQFTLETANVTLDEEYVRPFPGLKAGSYVMLAITDTGIGMSEEVKARVFEPFFSTKGVGQGTGLGLATCYGIVKQSDGHINVYSEVARGSTFKIYLPQVEQRATIPLPRANTPDLPRGTETILLAEDDPSLREMSATLLRRLGYTVLTAANGVEALGLKQQRDIGHIDLLFTDVVMPHMSGKELSDRIRTIYPRTRILFTSAYTESAIVHQGILNEGVALLQKPFTPAALAHKVREVLDQ